MVRAVPAAASSAVKGALDALADALDAVHDVLTYESVHQTVQGNYDRAAAAQDAISGEGLPPDPEGIRSPQRGIGQRHRVCLLFRPAGPLATAASRDRVEPTLSAWFSGILGDISRIACAAQLVNYIDKDAKAFDPLDINKATKAELEAALDASIAANIATYRQNNPDFRFRRMRTELRQNVKISDDDLLARVAGPMLRT